MDDEVSCVNRNEKPISKKSIIKCKKNDKNWLAGIVVRMMEYEIGKDDLNTLPSVTTKLVVTVHWRRVRWRVAGRGERAVLFHVTAE